MAGYREPASEYNCRVKWKKSIEKEVHNEGFKDEQQELITKIGVQ